MTDIAKAGSPNAAFLEKLDEAGEKLMGKSAWLAGGFAGTVAYKVKMLHITGSNLLTVSKPCGKSAKESGGTEDSFAQTPVTGGGSGGGSGSGGGVGGWSPGAGCYGNCQPPYAEVGDIQQM